LTRIRSTACPQRLGNGEYHVEKRFFFAPIDGGAVRPGVVNGKSVKVYLAIYPTDDYFCAVNLRSAKIVTGSSHRSMGGFKNHQG
jgi:hypothetical protein